MHWLPLIIAGTLGATTVLSRTALPVDETRYLTVAWEMYASGDYLVPHLNGETYAHKPPLLFWLINFVWLLTGPQEWSARLVAPLMSVVSVWLTRRLAKNMFPDRPIISEIAPLVHASMLLWLVFSPTTMFDATQTVFIQLTLLGLWKIACGGNRFDFLACGLPIGLAILTKGPVALVHVLPAALAVYFWAGESTNYRRYSLRVTASLVVAAIIGLSWAVPAAYLGGRAYGDELLWGQTAGRMVKSFAHQQPFWYYFVYLPFCLMPWAFYGGFWRSVRVQSSASGFRFAMVAALGSLMCLSLVSGKQPYYLVPALPMYALAIAGVMSSNLAKVTRTQAFVTGLGTLALGLLPMVLSRLPMEDAKSLGAAMPTWMVVLSMLCGIVILMPRRLALLSSIRVHAVCSAALISFLLLGLSDRFWPGFDLRPLSTKVKRLTDLDIPVAWYGKYHGQLGFMGRLTKPIENVESPDELARWFTSNPNGRLIIRTDTGAPEPERQVVSRYGNHIEFTMPVRRGLNSSTLAVMSLQSDRVASLPTEPQFDRAKLAN